jgi:hypothetical protein
LNLFIQRSIRKSVGAGAIEFPIFIREKLLEPVHQKKLKMKICRHNNGSFSLVKTEINKLERFLLGRFLPETMKKEERRILTAQLSEILEESVIQF